MIDGKDKIPEPQIHVDLQRTRCRVEACSMAQSTGTVERHGLVLLFCTIERGSLSNTPLSMTPFPTLKCGAIFEVYKSRSCLPLLCALMGFSREGADFTSSSR
jgi:hypothetical protein